MHVSCQIDEDLPYLLQFTGEDNLLVGSDYTHTGIADLRGDWVWLAK